MRSQQRHLGMPNGFAYGGWMHARTNVGRVDKTGTCGGADYSDNQTVGSKIKVDGRQKKKKLNITKYIYLHIKYNELEYIYIYIQKIRICF